MIMLFRQASRSFPNDIIEAARLDGLSEIGIFFRMFVPIMRSTYGAAMTVTFMNAWNSYLWPKIIFQSNASITMPMLVANLKSGYSVDYGMLMLGVLICTLPTAIIFLCLQRALPTASRVQSSEQTKLLSDAGRRALCQSLPDAGKALGLIDDDSFSALECRRTAKTHKLKKRSRTANPCMARGISLPRPTCNTN